MKIKFIKDCENGLKIGDIRNVDSTTANAIINLGLAEEVKATKPKQTRTKKEY